MGKDPTKGNVYHELVDSSVYAMYQVVFSVGGNVHWRVGPGPNNISILGTDRL